ncbi:MAG: putative hydro-lyase [Candidatus Sedimenticola sp. 6PFRAG7]
MLDSKTNYNNNHDTCSFNTPEDARSAIRSGGFTGCTSGISPGYVQGNLVILPRDWAYDFLQFCQNNPKPCPLIALSDPGCPLLPGLGQDLDIRTDIPEYNIFRNGELVEQVTDLGPLWQDDLVSFVLGCSFSFEEALIQNGLGVRNIDMGLNVSMYKSNIDTRQAGRFTGKMVVSMRPFSATSAIRAIQVTSRFPGAHGAPVHIGSPAQIGIVDLSRPDFGDSVEMNEDELPVFWACGVTPQLAIHNARPPLCITHVPGKMLITDKLNSELSVL